MAHNQKRCSICGEHGQYLGDGIWITLCRKHHAEELAKDAEKGASIGENKNEDYDYAEYDFPCGY